MSTTSFPVIPLWHVRLTTHPENPGYFTDSYAIVQDEINAAVDEGYGADTVLIEKFNMPLSQWEAMQDREFTGW